MLIAYQIIEVNKRKHYMQIEDCPFRLVIEDGEYVGWYYAGEREDDENNS